MIWSQGCKRCFIDKQKMCTVSIANSVALYNDDKYVTVEALHLA